MPGYFALGVNDPSKPDIELPFGKLRPDGMAAEFTVTPTNSIDVMIERLRANLAETQRIVTEQSECTLSLEPRFHTDFWYINALPKEYGDACSLQVLGCAPDKLIYTDEPIERPDPKTYPWRTSGGHIHVQVGDIASDLPALNFTVAALDLFIGTAATYLCTSEQAYERKKLYGQAGNYRDNGALGTIEYRTLPAQALIQTEKVARLMFGAAQQVCYTIMQAYADMERREFMRTMREKIGTFVFLHDEVAGAINAHDVDACKRLQEDAAFRFLDNPTLTAIVSELQSYALPKTFDLAWEL